MFCTAVFNIPIYANFSQRAILTRKVGHTQLVFGVWSGLISRSVHARLQVSVCSWLKSWHTHTQMSTQTTLWSAELQMYQTRFEVPMFQVTSNQLKPRFRKTTAPQTHKKMLYTCTQQLHIPLNVLDRVQQWLFNRNQRFRQDRAGHHGFFLWCVSKVIIWEFLQHT